MEESGDGVAPVVEEPTPCDEAWQQLMSRRQLLRGGMAGGAAGLLVAAGTGVAVWRITDAEMQLARQAADDEIARLRGLVERYEALEKVGLDGVLKTGMAAVAMPLGAVELGAKALREGLEAVEEALHSLEEAIPTAEEALAWLEARVSGMADAIDRLEGAVGDVLDKALETSVGAAMSEVADKVLDYLPFGLGDKIRGLFDKLVGLLTSVDDLVLSFSTTVLHPLRERWFSLDEGKGVRSSLVTPLVEHLLDPLEEHLTALASLADNWQQQLSAPLEQALEERAAIREEIAQYKGVHGLD